MYSRLELNSSMSKIKILCAEDDQLVRLEIKEKMEAKGWEVIEAGDGVKAFEQYKKHNPDLVVLDVDMPLRSGLQVLQLIQLNDLLTPVIMYSSLAGNEDVEAGLRSGAKVYLVKTYNVDNLLLQAEKLIVDKNVDITTLADGVTYNFISAELKIGEVSERLGRLERKVFAVLCRNKNKLCQRDLLLVAGWDSTAVNFELQLNKQIGKLKKKISGAVGVEIVVDRGCGYSLKTK